MINCLSSLAYFQKHITFLKLKRNLCHYPHACILFAKIHLSYEQKIYFQNQKYLTEIKEMYLSYCKANKVM